MALTTHADFRTELATWLNDSSLGTAQLDSLIAAGEWFVYRDVNLKEQEADLNVTISGSGTAALPTDYHQLKFAYIDTSPVQKLERKTAEWIYGNYPYRSSYSKPKFVAREGDNLIFGPAPDSTYTVKGVYYNLPTNISDVSADATVNPVAISHPYLMVFGILSQAEPYIGRDERIQVWEAKYSKFKQAAQKDYDDEGISGGPLAMVAG